MYADNFVTCLCAIQWSCFYGPLCLSFKEGVEKWIKVHFIEFRRVGQAWATCRLRTLFSSFVRFGDKTHQTLDSASKKPIFHSCAAQTSNHQVTQKSHMAEALVCWQFACKWPAVIEIDLLLVLKCFEGIQLHVHCERPALMVSKQCLPMALCVGSLFAEFWIANCRLERFWSRGKTASPVQLCPCHSYISHILKFHDFILLQGGDYSEKGDAWGVITRTGRWSRWSWVLSEPRQERLITSRCCLDTSFDDRLQTISRGEMLSAFRCFWIFWIRIILTFTGRGCCHLSLCSADWKPGGHEEVWEEFGFPY